MFLLENKVFETVKNFIKNIQEFIIHSLNIS